MARLPVTRSYHTANHGSGRHKPVPAPVRAPWIEGLPDLIDETGLAGADRLRVEEALDRQWMRLAAAIGTRRRDLGAVAVDRAQLLAGWGPAWELSASPTVAAEGARPLDAVGIRQRPLAMG